MLAAICFHMVGRAVHLHCLALGLCELCIWATIQSMLDLLPISRDMMLTSYVDDIKLTGLGSQDVADALDALTSTCL